MSPTSPYAYAETNGTSVTRFAKHSAEKRKRLKVRFARRKFGRRRKKKNRISSILYTARILYTLHNSTSTEPQKRTVTRERRRGYGPPPPNGKHQTSAAALPDLGARPVASRRRRAVRCSAITSRVAPRRFTPSLSPPPPPSSSATRYLFTAGIARTHIVDLYYIFTIYFSFSQAACLRLRRVLSIVVRTSVV